MNKIRSYSSPFNFGHKALEKLFSNTVVVQEKVDGSQFSFMKTENNELLARSRRVQIAVSEHDTSMFKHAIQTVLDIAHKLPKGVIFRCEYLQKPKHNTLKYERVPKGNLILFDVDRGDQDYCTPNSLINAASSIGLECVPALAIYNVMPSVDELKKLLEIESILGGAMEGVVIKNYQQFDERSKKTLMAKYVSDDFKENHKKDWKGRNPSDNTVVDNIIQTYRTRARWLKAIQHLKEEGKIEGVVQDIPILLKEVNVDIMNEAEEKIKDLLFKYFWKKISRGITNGLPEFYKSHLVESALKGEEK